MRFIRIAVLVAFAGIAAGCSGGGPERASNIQNLNGIGDDISATTMTDSESRHPHDPNLHTTLPNTYETVDQQ
jgi:hypothetical protein